MKLLLLVSLYLPISALLLSFSMIALRYPTLYQTTLVTPARVLAVDSEHGQTLSPPNIIPQQDIRILALRSFFNEYPSPLAEHADELIKQADLNGMDYAILPAVAMQESGGCRVIPEGSYNCWGFGIYGSKVTRFQSYPEAIARIAKVMKETYIKKGLTNVTLVEDRWTPSSNGTWSYSVNFFIGKIRQFEKQITAS